jgi:hypothetical protein
MDVQQVPHEVARLADSHGLGAWQRTLESEAQPFVTFSLVVFLVLGAVFAVCTAVLLVVVVTHPTGAGPGLMLLLITGVPALGLGRLAFTTIKSRRVRAGTRYFVFSEGVVLHRGGVDEAVAWRGIDRVYQSLTTRYVNGVNTGTWSTGTILCGDGRRIKIVDRTEAARQLAELVQRRVAEHKLASAVSDLHSGLTLDFDVFAIDNEGITVKKKRTTVPWNQVRQVQARQGTVTITTTSQRRTSWFPTARSSDIPNYALFMTLVEHMARTR